MLFVILTNPVVYQLQLWEADLMLQNHESCDVNRLGNFRWLAIGKNYLA